MSKWIITLVGLLFFSSSNANFQQNISNQELYLHGKQAYEMRCSGCHGKAGNGQGPGAVFLDPKPRDFTTGVFKFKSTPIDALPTDEDLMRILSKGVAGTSMPAFPLVPEQERFAIIQYIKGFSTEWSDKERIQSAYSGATFPLEDFKDHGKFIERATKGRALYVESCAVCHGQKGIGDGPGAVDLEDDWGNPIKPADISKKTIKSGKSVKDIYRVILSGIGGTPMPSFKDAYSDEELWDLAAFILYLRGKANDHYGDKDYVKPISKEEVGEE
ncbi:MAG: cytochrome c [Bacteriovoracaceae bacterium]